MKTLTKLSTRITNEITATAIVIVIAVLHTITITTATETEAITKNPITTMILITNRTITEIIQAILVQIITMDQAAIMVSHRTIVIIMKAT
jgi:hypothetical protein